MTTLPDLTLTSTLVLDRTTVLYGETGSGKSTVIVDILYLLQSYVEQVIVISPTDRQNHTYDSGLVPTPCIHYTITSQLLDDIWARQNALVSVYSRANNSSTLQSLFNRIVDNRVSRAIISDINRKLEDGRKEINAAESNTKTASSKIKDMEREYGKFTNLIYKQSINENRGYLQKLNLSKDEAFSLVYLNLNPRLVLIFDDCTEQLRRFKTHPVIQMLFYQGRWSYITAIIACHTDKALDPELKKNAYINIFTED
jgi:RecA/RadA recombinase